MARTAAPAIPGTEPTPAPDAFQAEGSMDTGPENDLDSTSQLKAQVAELSALVKQLAKNQSSASPAPVKHPTMAAVIKSAPKVPVLTEDGWYVPEVHPTDRLKGA